MMKKDIVQNAERRLEGTQKQSSVTLALKKNSGNGAISKTKKWKRSKDNGAWP